MRISINILLFQVWSDLKNKIKKKLAHNKKEITGTGGGSNNSYVFSVQEESVISLLSLQKTSSSNRTFGLDVEPENVSMEHESNAVRDEEIIFETEEEHHITADQPDIVNTPARSTRKHNKPSEPHNFQHERKTLLEKQTLYLEETAKYTKECARYARKTFEIKEKKLQLWKSFQLDKKKYRMENMEFKLKNLKLKQQKLAFQENQQK